MKKFMEGGVNHRILELLVDYLLPAHLDIVTEFVLEDSDRMIRLADETSDLNSVLGADTYLV